MLSYIEWNVRPQLADLGFLELRWYSLMFLVGFIVAYYILTKMFTREGKSIELLDKLTFYVVISTILGARIGHCLFYEPEVYLHQPWKMILPFEGTPGVDFQFTGFQGLASHGGALGILLGIYIFSRKYKLSYLWILDRVVIVTAQAGAMIRIGNFFNSEIVGIPTTLPWGVKFLRLAPGVPIDQILPLHPAQLYEAICYFIIFAILMLVYTKKFPNFKPGIFLGLFFVLVFAFRFFIEFIKEDQVGFESGMTLNMGQWLSIPFVITGLYFIFRKAKTVDVTE